MTIAIIDRSEPAALRLGSMVSSIKGVKNIIQIIDMEQILDTLSRVHVQIIIYDVSINGNGWILRLQEIKESLPETFIIALASSSVAQYRSKCREIGIKYCLDKNSEYTRIPKIVSNKIKESNKA